MMLLKNRTTYKIIFIFFLAICGVSSLYHFVSSPLGHSSYTPKKALASPIQAHYTATSVRATEERYALASTSLNSAAELIRNNMLITTFAVIIACIILYYSLSSKKKQDVELNPSSHSVEAQNKNSNTPKDEQGVLHYIMGKVLGFGGLI